MFKFPNMIGIETPMNLDTDIRENLRLIIRSRVSELFGDPRFGSLLYSDLFKPLNPLTEDDIRTNLTEAIEAYEKRVKVVSIDISEMIEGKKVVVTLNLQIVETQSILSMSVIKELENEQILVY
mgnify:CR=1 FL=1